MTLRYDTFRNSTLHYVRLRYTCSFFFAFSFFLSLSLSLSLSPPASLFSAIASSRVRVCVRLSLPTYLLACSELCNALEPDNADHNDDALLRSALPSEQHGKEWQAFQ